MEIIFKRESLSVYIEDSLWNYGICEILIYSFSNLEDFKLVQSISNKENIDDAEDLVKLLMDLAREGSLYVK